jgi:hexosaminidase
MKKAIALSGLILLLSGNYKTTAQKSSFFNVNNLRVSWQLIANAHKGGSAALAFFTIRNTAKTPFPNSGWTIYFNSSQPVNGANVSGGAVITHVNGDIFQLNPGPSFPVLKKNDSLRIEYYTDGTIINYTACPSGLYIVWHSNPSKGYSLSGYSIKPLDETTAGIVSPERIYNQNSVVKDIPEKELPKIFPTAVSYTEAGGSIQIDSRIVINGDPLFRNEMNYLAGELRKLFQPVAVLAGINRKENSIRIEKAQLPAEAYRLSVSEAGIDIEAADEAGVFYGIQSLFSLMPPGSWRQPNHVFDLPIVKVEDQPRFGYRSLMLDVARNFKPKQVILKVLDMMALYKLNVLHLHFSDDEGWRIEIPSLPELTAVGALRGHTMDSKDLLPPSYASGPDAGKSLGTGFYSKDDFIEILKYATTRHIQVIPEIESPGHSRAAIKAMDARYERLLKTGQQEEAEKYLLRDLNDQSVYSSAQQWTDNVICVARPSVYSFLEKVITELQGMYKEAGAPLKTIHLGGDEVPAGAWEKSPLCQELIKTDPQLDETNDLWYYYFGKLNKIIQSKGLYLSGWEEAGMRKTKLNGKTAMIVNPRFANEGMQLHVWNNVTGWGAEDLPYRLANAGYKVVLSPVSNNYLDLAYYKHPDEPGYYWGGFQDIDKPFYFIPYDYYKNSKEDPDGNPVDPSVFIGKDRLTDFGKSNIVGIEGLLWAENLRTVDLMEYLLLPKLLGVAERAWSKDPAWAVEADSVKAGQLYREAWSVFLNQLGKRELPRLDYFAGGFNYRIPAAGIKVENGKVWVNGQFPGLQARYTINGDDPQPGSNPVTGPIEEKGWIKVRIFDGRGRGSRTSMIEIR